MSVSEASALAGGVFDYCVIGSGPAGGVAAVTLAEKGFSVLVLEAGTEEFGEVPHDEIGTVHVGGEADLQFGRAIQIGGSSNLWAGRVAPLEPIDFEVRDWVTPDGWPISGNALSDYYRRARELMDSPDPGGSIPKMPEQWRRMCDSGVVETKAFSWAPEAFRVGPWLKAAERRLERLVLTPRVRVTELVEDGDGRITGAIAYLPDGERTTVRAGTFILAAGGIESTRLLLNSTARCQNGIGNQFGNVGRYFSTHPKADMAVMVLNSRTAVHHPLFTDTDFRLGTMRLGVGLSAPRQRAQGLLNHYAQLSPFLEYRASRAFEIARGRSAISSPLLNRSAIVRGFLPGLGLAVFAGISRLARWQPTARTLTLRGYFDQFPCADNRLARSEDSDRYGVPKVDISWSFGDRDKASVLGFLAAFDAEVRRHGIGHIDYEPLRTLERWPMTSIHSHFMGSTRMGADPERSVVDSNCRVHSTRNLYIAGPSVFPTYGYANPFLTIVALSYRLADHLAGLGHQNGVPD
ncbi:MAG: GMC oxidoreductase [Gammaproteobacteria bacterium]